MLFTSPFFLYIFLPLIFVFYFITPKKYRNLTLLIFSLSFYAWGEQFLVLIILASAITDFLCGLIISNGYKKLGLTISILFNLGLLFYFKFSDFFYTSLLEFLDNFGVSITNKDVFTHVVLPLGISFYTFQTMSYTIDVYNGKVKATKNFINFFTFVSLFPQLIAGPIVRYKQIEKELVQRSITFQNFSKGIERFIIGLAKKVIIANNCAFVVDGIFKLDPSEMSALTGWIGVLFYSLQIYYDFSGYSDMAIGLGKMFGFNFPENFNFPYISRTIQEFWKRWHITLSTWFKDYLYIPLGGNRMTKIRVLFNLIFVFFVTGLWHGAQWSFVLWGLLHGILILLEKIGLKKTLDRLPNFIGHLYFLFALNMSWVLFKSDTLSQAVLYAKAMFNFTTPINFEFLDFLLTKEVLFFALIGVLFSTPWFKNKLVLLSSIKEKRFRLVKYVSLIVLFIMVSIYISVENYNPFIYFRF